MTKRKDVRQRKKERKYVKKMKIRKSNKEDSCQRRKKGRKKERKMKRRKRRKNLPTFSPIERSQHGLVFNF